jgi:choline dehydrogenase-like flavoprotein
MASIKSVSLTVPLVSHRSRGLTSHVIELEAQAWVSDLNTTYARDGADGNNTGLIWTAQTVSGVTGERSSAGTAYYQPVSNRTNLHLLVRHYGAKIVFEGNSTIAAGLQVHSRDSTNSTRFITSSNIIVASGAINTPRLLQLSGIGPKDLLESLDIKTLVDAPGVGANFQDHPAMYLSFQCKSVPRIRSIVQKLFSSVRS